MPLLPQQLKKSPADDFKDAIRRMESLKNYLKDAVKDAEKMRRNEPKEESN